MALFEKGIAGSRASFTAFFFFLKTVITLKLAVSCIFCFILNLVLAF